MGALKTMTETTNNPTDESKVEIFSSWGVPLEIVAKHGEAKVKGATGETLYLTLVTCRRDDGSERAYFAETLRSTAGFNGISDAVSKAPEVTLTAAERKAKINQAM